MHMLSVKSTSQAAILRGRNRQSREQTRTRASRALVEGLKPVTNLGKVRPIALVAKCTTIFYLIARVCSASHR